MNNVDFDDLIVASRIRSERSRRRRKQKDIDKKLIRYHKEELAIRDRIRNLGWTPLDPPVQRGFIRFFVLRDDVRRTKYASFFGRILEKINTEQWSHRKDFKRKRKKFGRKIQVVREQSLREIGEGEFFGKKFTESERLFFYEALIHPKGSKTPVKVYRFIDPWRFVLRIQPNMITKVRIKDLDLERKSDEIDRYFNHVRRHRLLKLLYGGNRWKWDHIPAKKYENPLHNRSFADILQEYWPEPKLTVAYRNPLDLRVSSFYQEQVVYRFLIFVYTVRKCSNPLKFQLTLWCSDTIQKKAYRFCSSNVSTDPFKNHGHFPVG